MTNEADGTIVGTSSVGIWLDSQGTVANSGLVDGQFDGLVMYEGGSITNSAGGTIVGGNNGVQFGVYDEPGLQGTFDNAGTVMGNVDFAATGGAYRLIAEPGALFEGNIYGGGGVLELASGSSAGTLSGIGSSITNFTSLQFDGGSPWSVSGNTAGLTAMSAITGLSAGDTIDLTGVAATSEYFVNGALTLTNSAAVQTVLNFPDNSSLADFAFAPDGAGGTDIAGAGSGQTVTWNGGNGDWNDASKWSPQAVPTGFDTATIANPGTVTLPAAANNAVANVAINGSGDTLEVDGSLVITGTATIDAGALIDKGTMAAAAIVDNALLAFAGDQVLANAPLSLDGTLAVQNAGTLTLGPSETITQTGTSATIDSTAVGGESIINQGTIDANSGGSLAILPLNFTNAGTIDGTGETLTVGYDNAGVLGSWDNSAGTIANANSLVLDGSVTTGHLGAITAASAITEAGLLDNSGATVAVGSSGTLGTISLISSGIVSGGTILDNNGDGFAFDGGTLDGVTYQGPLELINTGDRVTIAHGLIVTGAGGSLPGTIDLTGAAAILDLAGTLDNVTLNIGSDAGDTLSADQGGTVTLGQNASIVSLGAFATLLAGAGTTLDLLGTVSASSDDTVTLADSGGTFGNDGTIAVNGGTIDVNTPLTGVGSGGTIEVGGGGGGAVNVSKAVAADQTLAFTDASGLLQLNDPASFAGSITGFNLGSTIDLTNFIGTITSFANNLLTVHDASDTQVQLHVQGPFNPNEFVSTSDGNNGTDITWMSAPGTFTWIGGSANWNAATAWDLGSVPTGVDGAVIAQAGTNTVTIDQAETIANLTLDGANDTVDIVATGFLQAQTITINAGTLADTGGFAASQITDDGVLDIITDAAQTLDITPLSLGGTLLVSSAFDLPGTLTLGPGEIVTQDGASALIASSGNLQNEVLNLGTIDADFSGGSMTIAPQNFVNQGTIDATGETLTIGYDNGGVLGSWSNNGGTIANAASLVMDGSLTTGNIGLITGAVGITEAGVLDNTGATLNVGTELGTPTLTSGGVVSGGTIVDGGGGFAFSGGTLSDVTYQGPLELMNPDEQAVISNGLIVTDGSLPGTIDLTGAGASLDFATPETLADVTVNIGNATTADVLRASFNGGSLIIGSNASIVSADPGALATLTAGTGSTLDLLGTLDAIASAGTFTLGDTGGTFSNDGTIAVDDGDTLNAATAITAGAGSGTIDVGGGSVADFSGAVAAAEALVFTDATGILRLHQPTAFAATIDGFVTGNAIDLAGIAADTAVWSAGTLTISNTGSMVAALSLSGDYSAEQFNVASDDAGGSLVTVTATCYAAGTRILTPHGEIAIEHLRAGDLVQTVSGRAQRIDWIGRRRVDFRRHPNRDRVLPVRIAAHAFGRNRPRRELLLSPDHAVFVEDVLIPIRHLINGTTVVQITRQAIVYYHIELPRHDVLLANGMPAESYLEAGARDAFANGDGIIQLHPDFAPPPDHYAMLWEALGYAPLVVTGAALERVREALAIQAQRYSRSHRSRGASSRRSAPAA